MGAYYSQCVCHIFTLNIFAASKHHTNRCCDVFHGIAAPHDHHIYRTLSAGPIQCSPIQRTGQSRIRAGLLRYVAFDFRLIFFPFGVPQTIDSIPISDGRPHPGRLHAIRALRRLPIGECVSVNTAKQSANSYNYNDMSFAEFMASQQRGKQCCAPTATRYPPEKRPSPGATNAKNAYYHPCYGVDRFFCASAFSGLCTTRTRVCVCLII